MRISWYRLVNECVSLQSSYVAARAGRVIAIQGSMRASSRAFDVRVKQ